MGGTCEVMSCTVGIWKHARLRLEETQLVSDKLRPFKMNTSPAFGIQFFNNTYQLSACRDRVFILAKYLGHCLTVRNMKTAAVNEDKSSEMPPILLCHGTPTTHIRYAPHA